MEDHDLIQKWRGVIAAREGEWIQMIAHGRGTADKEADAEAENEEEGLIPTEDFD